MISVLFATACFVLATIALGLFVIIQRAAGIDQLMAVQLLGTGGVAVLLLLAAAMRNPAVQDVALVLALFTAFAAAAFVRAHGAASQR